MNPPVTVGIPCYNAEAWIGVALRSALDQSHRPIEIIVVDDGSTDGSRRVAESFGHPVRVIAGTHKGASAARNAVLTEARGEWIQYLDADDYLIPVKIGRQLEEAGPRLGVADVLYAPTFTEDWSRGDARDRRVIPINPALDPVSQWLLWQLPQTGGSLWRRESLERLDGWNEDSPCCQEHELYLRALQAGMTFLHTPSPGAVYRIWSEQTLCRRDPLLTLRERTRLTETMLLWLEQSGRASPEHTKAAGRAFLEMARTLAKHDPDEAARYHDEHKARGLINLRDTPAAPIAYRLAYRVAGFRAAEKIAASLRRTSQ